MRKGKKVFNGQPITAQMLDDTDALNDIMKADDGFRHMQAVRGSPAYWKKVMNDLFSMLRQVGLPTFFMTFSCAELSRWPETIETILKQEGKEADFQTLDFAKKCEILRSNPVTAVRMFYHRVNALMKDLIKSPAEPIGKVTDSFYRVEFQQRGAPHIHCLFWVENAPVYGQSSSEDIEGFVKKYISCTLPDEQEDPELHEIVKSVQTHRKKHSKSCKKGGKECRFNYPRCVSTETVLVDIDKPNNSQETQDTCSAEAERQTTASERPRTEEERFEAQFGPLITMNKTRAKTVLQNLALLQRDESSEALSTEELLAKAGFQPEETVRDAMEHIGEKNEILLQRNPKEMWVNNYNPSLLRAWNANMDIQYVLSAESCVMYILSYISKSEHELGELLHQAKVELREKDNLDLKSQMKKLGFVYFSNREMSVQEAVVRTCGLPLKDCSRETVFVSTDAQPTRLSKPLSLIKLQSANDKDSEEIWMTSLYDRYCARPENTEFSDMCQATFASNYRTLSKTEATRSVRSKNPNVSALQNDLGHVMKRTRSKPAVIRYARHKKEKYPEQFYLTLLKLYLPHRSPEQLLPRRFQTHEEFFENGCVALHSEKMTKPVQEIVRENQKIFDQHAPEFDDAWEQLQRVGVLEDAWAQVAPQTEEERLDAMREKENVDGNSVEEGDIPGLSATPVKENNVASLCSVELIGDSTRHLLKTMNQKQQKIFYFVREHCVSLQQNSSTKPFFVHVSGGAGVGKSHLIKCIYNEASKILRNGESPSDTTVLLTAPTGTAAFNVGGYTIHSAFKIPRNPQSYYVPLSNECLNTLAATLGNLKLLIIDEVSMVNRNILSYIHGRLTQIKHFKTNQGVWFGNVSVLAVGDFYQLPPVKAKSLMIPDTREAFDLWHDLFTICSLDEIMRQRDDAAFAALLNRLRVKSKNDDLASEDNMVLQRRADTENEPEMALHVFATNALTTAHNEKIMSNISAHPRRLKARDYRKDDKTGRTTQCECKGSTDELVDSVDVDKSARVMLTRNIDVKDGLVNGAFGTIVGFEPEDDNQETEVVFVKFDSDKVGKGLQGKVPKHPSLKGSVPVTRHVESLASTKHVTRMQFPFKLAWACTVHKTQGMTVQECVFDMQKIFQPGQAYVALSRVTSLTGLHIKNYDQAKIYMHEDVHTHIQTMNQLFDDVATIAEPQNKLTVLHHNVQGLRSKLQDIQSHHEILCDVMMFSETLLTTNVPTQMLDIGNYTLHRQERNCTGRGGLATYTRDLAVERIDYNIPEIEHLALKVDQKDGQVVLLVNMYRPPTQAIIKFTEALDGLLFQFEMSDELRDAEKIISGDLNENLLAKTSKRIFETFMKHGYKQHVRTPTTDSGTLLDVIYTKIKNASRCEVIPTYYSDHDAVQLTILETLATTESTAITDECATEALETSSVDQSAETHNERQPVKKKSGATSQNDKCQSTKVPSASTSSGQKLANKTNPRKRTANASEKKSKGNRCNTRPEPPNRFSKRGIENFGSTCYANSVLQLFFSLVAFEPLLHVESNLSKALQHMDHHMHNSQTMLSPTSFFERDDMLQFRDTNVQQDAHEFLLHLLQNIHEQERGRISPTSDTKVDTLLGLATSNSYLCHNCDHKKTTRADQALNISVPIRATSFEIEPSIESSNVSCEMCKTSTTTSSTDIILCPPILVVHLLRFGNNGRKLQTYVQMKKEIRTKSNVSYKLRAFVNHLGHSLHQGHYTVTIQDLDGQWHTCDDTNVNVSALPNTSKTAYIMIYEKQN